MPSVTTLASVHRARTAASSRAYVAHKPKRSTVTNRAGSVTVCAINRSPAGCTTVRACVMLDRAVPVPSGCHARVRAARRKLAPPPARSASARAVTRARRCLPADSISARNGATRARVATVWSSCRRCVGAARPRNRSCVTGKRSARVAASGRAPAASTSAIGSVAMANVRPVIGCAGRRYRVASTSAARSATRARAILAIRNPRSSVGKC